MWKLKVELKPGEMTPNWYGVAYHNYCNRITFAYPIPINFLVRWKESFRWWLKAGRSLVTEEIYCRGYSDGRRFEVERQRTKLIEGIVQGFERAKS